MSCSESLVLTAKARLLIVIRKNVWMLFSSLLEVALGDLGISNCDGDLRLVTGNLHDVSEHSSLLVDLDLVDQELLEGCNLHNLVLHGLAASIHGEK